MTLLFLYVLSGSIMYLSGNSLPPYTVQDTPAVWTYYREQVAKHKTPLVIIGASQMQKINVLRFQKKLQKPSYQLAKAGTPFLPTLKHLATDSTFKGDILVDFPLSYIYGTRLVSQENNPVHHMNALIEAYQQQKYSHGLAYWLDIKRQQIIFIPPLKGTLSQKLMKLPQTQEHLLKERISMVNYSNRRTPQVPEYRYAIMKANNLKSIKIHLSQGAPDSVWVFDMFKEVEGYVQAIQKRGGTVSFVRFPTAPEHYALEQQLFPRERYWDKFVSMTSAQTFHFKDYPSTDTLTCPDGTHLIHKDADFFADEVMKVLYPSKTQ